MQIKFFFGDQDRLQSGCWMFTSLEKSSYGYLLCEMIEDAKSTPLSRAREAVQRVAGLSNCGQLDVPRRRGRTLLQLASEHNKPDFVRLLLEASASVHPRLTTSENLSPLTSAVRNHNEEIVRVLLQAGMNPNYKNNARLNFLLIENGALGNNVLTLHLTRLDLRDLPSHREYWSSFSSLTHLNLSHNNMLTTPSVLSVMPSLLYLNLSNNCLQALPPNLAQLTTLKVLDLSHNNLQTLPATFATMPCLQKVPLEGNPLSDIPISFRKSGWSNDLKTYLQSILEKSEDFSERKILLVGQEGVGKSTLLRCLCDPKGRTNVKQNVATDGIGVKTFSLSTSAPSSSRFFSRTKYFQFTAWDLGGQEVFYPSHQFFLTSQSIYLVVFNLACPNYERLEYWMNQLRSSAPADQLSPVLLIGTHADTPGCREPAYLNRVKAEIRTRFPTQRFPALQGSMICDCGSGGGVPAIKEKLVVVATAMKTIVSPSWICLQQLLHKKLEQNINYLSWADYQSLAARSHVSQEELQMTTKFLQDVGCVIHFDDDRSKLQELVILHPQWLASLMASFISFSHKWDRDGRIGRSQIAQVLKAYPPSLHEPLLDLLEKFGILVRLPRKNYTQILIPSLLPESRPNGFFHSSPEHVTNGWARICPSSSIEHSRIYDFSFLPLGFFDRVLVATYFLAVPTHQLVTWRHGTLLARKESPNERCLITFHSNGDHSRLYSLYICARMEMNVFSQGVPNLLLNEVVHLVEHIISCYFPRLQDGVRRYIPCLHCARHRTVISHEPYKFSYEDCVAAITRGDPILYCHGIRTPQRAVLVSSLAPDIAFRGYAVLKESELGDREKDWSLLGEGGFGRVYKTYYQEQEVAVKELVSDEADSFTEKFSEFQKEVQIMSVLRHQNIVNLIGITVKPLLIVAEYVRGGDLHQVLRGAKAVPLTWAQKFRIAFDVATGMEYLQALTPPIVHRDLRSPNIFIDSLDVSAAVCAKVADFGLSAFVSQDVAGALLTWQWLAPEVLNYEVKSYDERSDIYSFAIVLWELTTGEMPFDEFSRQTSDPHAIKRAIIHSGLRPTIPSDCPEVFASLMESCWCHSPSKRPTFSEILQTLSPHVPDTVNASRAAQREVQHHSPVVVVSNDDRIDSPTLKSFQEIAPLKRPHELPLNEAVSCLLTYAEALWVGMDSGKVQVYNLSQIEHLPVDKDCLKLAWFAHRDRVFDMIMVPKRRQSEVWTGSGDRKIAAWDGHSGQCLWETELRSLVSALHFLPSAEGDHVWAAAGEENALYVFSSRDYSMVRLVALPNNSPCFSITNHFDNVLVGTLGVIYIFDSSGEEIASWSAHQTDRPVRFIQSSSVYTSCPIASRGYIWTSSGNVVKGWAFPSGPEISITGFQEVQAHDARLTTMNLSQQPKGDLELWTSSYDYCNFLWNAEDTQPYFEFQLSHTKEFIRDVEQYHCYAIVGSSYRDERSGDSCGCLYFYRRTE